MSQLPNAAMREVAAQIIDLLGEDRDFARCDAGVWRDSASAVRVYLRSEKSSRRQSVRGVENYSDFKAVAPSLADIRNGDRTIIGSSYFIVDAFEHHGTHVEFLLKQTDEQPDS